MRVLGIDPGISYTGWGVIEERDHSLFYLDAGIIRAGGAGDVPRALKTVHGGVDDVIRRYAPEEAAVEDVFSARNARAALILGHARGAALLALADAGVSIHEYTALEVKKALVGYGGAGKDQVKTMVRKLLQLSGECEDHCSDALAVAICHLHSAPLKKKLTGIAPRAR